MTTTEFTPEARDALESYLARDGYIIPSGLGTEEAACSIAAINLALTGELTDTIPDCMSFVIGQWTLVIQDAIPTEMRNSPEWKAALVEAAGSGRSREIERLNLIMAWMWETVLPSLQPLADLGGYSVEWQTMCSERTKEAVRAARVAAESAARRPRPRAASAKAAALVAARVARVTLSDTWPATAAKIAAWTAAWTAWTAADAAGARAATAWKTFNPTDLLGQLVNA